MGMQKELLEAYEKASRVWLARVKSEVDLWSKLAPKLTATRLSRKRSRRTRHAWRSG
jgi:hypothetical protein